MRSLASPLVSRFLSVQEIEPTIPQRDITRYGHHIWLKLVRDVSIARWTRRPHARDI